MVLGPADYDPRVLDRKRRIIAAKKIELERLEKGV